MCGQSRRSTVWTGFLLVAMSLCVDAAHAAEPLTPADDFQITHEGSGLSLHDEMFVLPFTYADAYRGRQIEIVFQISAKQALFGSRVYVGYTQLSFWQAYDVRESAPFRETDYNPEFFYRLSPRPYREGRLGGDAGIEHESNGQRGDLSRSWNQVYVAPYYQRDNLLLRLKIRWRLPEAGKETPESAEGDDNPDITDYLGYADIHLYYRWPSSRQMHLMVRGNPATGRGQASVNLSWQLPHEQNAWLVFTLSHGYGESLLDYDRKISRMGVGVMLAR
jgi:phospholipase A1